MKVISIFAAFKKNKNKIINKHLPTYILEEHAMSYMPLGNQEISGNQKVCQLIPFKLVVNLNHPHSTLLPQFNQNPQIKSLSNLTHKYTYIIGFNFFVSESNQHKILLFSFLIQKSLQ